MKYFSLFSGIGGFELGIQKAVSNQNRGTQPRTGWEHKRDNVHIVCKHETTCVGFSEINKDAIKIYQRHFPSHKNYGDATKIDPADLPDFDMLCGGFPCQSFSIAGKRKGFEDTRGTLFHEILRIASEKKPGVVFLENVKGLLSADNGRCFGTIICSLDELGYDVEWQVLNSKNFGVPQNRERVFIVGHLRGKGGQTVFPLRQSDRVLETEDGGQQEDGEGVCSTIDSRYGALRNAGETYIIQDSPRDKKLRRYAKVGTTLASNSGVHRGDKNIVVHSMYPRSGNPDEGGTGHLKRGDGFSYCLDSGKSQVLELATHLRRLTPVECERLQGFPDGWTDGISDSQRYKCLGNAVTVNVIEEIMCAIGGWF